MPKKTWAWRKTVMTKETLDKLEMAFMNSFTDEEACLYAGIHSDTLYKYCTRNPDFSRKKEALKNKPSMKAKLNIVRRINSWDEKDVDQRRLERKNKREFSKQENIELTGKGWWPVETLIKKIWSKSKDEWKK